jgi:hypothetical protein
VLGFGYYLQIAGYRWNYHRWLYFSTLGWVSWITAGLIALSMGCQKTTELHQKQNKIKNIQLTPKGL